MFHRHRIITIGPPVCIAIGLVGVSRFVAGLAPIHDTTKGIGNLSLHNAHIIASSDLQKPRMVLGLCSLLAHLHS